jgi:hypothetical protein
MDWLRNYGGVILCAKRAVRLTTEHGTTVEFSVVMTTNQTSMLNQVDGNCLEEIRVVLEYPDVFSKELPGMPHVHVSYAAPQAHGIVNVALHREYSPGIVFIFSQRRKDLYQV